MHVHSRLLFSHPALTTLHHTQGINARRLALGLLDILARQRLLGGNLLLGLLVAVHDQLVQEAARLPLRILVVFFSLADVAAEIAVGLIIDIVLVVEVVKVGCTVSVR